MLPQPQHQPAPVEREVFVSGRAGERIPVRDASVVQTTFFVSQFFKKGQWLIVRPGTGGVLLTSDVGLTALRRFRRRASVSDVKRHIGRARDVDPERINLAPLLASAAEAGMVRSVDGVAVRAPRVAPARFILHLFKIAIYPSLYALVDRLPVRLRERLLFMLQWQFEGRFAYESGRADTLRNLAALFPGESADRLARTARAFYRQRTRSALAFLTTRKTVAQIHHWLDVFMEPEVPGDEAFQRCLAAGKGVILVSYHVGCYWLVPSTLFKRGLRAHVLMGAVSDRERELDGVSIPGHPQSGLTFYSPNMHSLARLARVLSDGGIVVIYADAHGVREAPARQFARETWGKAGAAAAAFSLLGHPFPVERSLRWLHAETGAAVLPVVLSFADQSWNVRLAFGQPVLAADDLTAGVYGHLERCVRDRPEQWAYLNTFPTKGHKE